MPVTRRRAAAAAPEVVEEERAAVIDISSDSDTGSEEEEEDTSDEDFVDISDSDSEAGSETGEDSEEELGPEVEADEPQLGADRSEAACSKIAGLLRSGRTLEGIKLVECKAYLKKNDLSQTGDLATCVDRIMLHWKFKDGDPEKIYPRSSFCINCKGDVCRGDDVLFKQKVHEKSGKRHAKCTGKRIVAGKVIKESYGKQKQQHTFTIQVFWSRGAGKLPPLHLLLVKGRNLYRMMTFRQLWPNEAERLKSLEEKHNRGDTARSVRALNRSKSAGNTLKGKKTLEKEKHKSQYGRSDRGSNITKVDTGKKRPAQSSKFDQPNKRSKKEGCQVPSRDKCTDGRGVKKNCASLDTSKKHSTLQRNHHKAPLNKDPSSTEVGMSKRKPGYEQNCIGRGHAGFEERCITSASHVQANHGNLVGMQHPFVVRPQRPPPLRNVGNLRLPQSGGSSIPCPSRPGPDALVNTTMGFWDQNVAMMGGPHAPAYRGRHPPNHQRVAILSPNMPQAVYHPHPEAAYVMPQAVYHPHPEAAYVMPHLRYPSWSSGFRR